jgi:RNA polymerase sigma factor (sigma-70 family)
MCDSSNGRGGLAADEATLFQQAQAGSPDCLNALMTRHEGLVQAVVRAQVLGDLPFAEALHEARLGLWRAILRYDPTRGTAFSTYAWPSMMHHVWRAVKAATPAAAAAARAQPPAERLDLAAVGEATLIREALYALVRRLPARFRYLIIARYGLDGRPPRSFAHLGRGWGVSREQVRLWHTAALVWLRHPAHSQLLRSLLARHTAADYQWADEQAQRWLRQRGGRREP